MMKRLGLNLPEDEETPPYAGPVRPAEFPPTPGMETELPEQPEVTAQREQAEERERFAASPEGRYSAALKAAEEAGPTEEDYRQAAIRQSIAQVGAGMPGYLQQMSTTLFHKPDFSQQAAAAREQARQPDMVLTAKEQAQKRLEGLAETARKRALLPGELKKQEAETSMAQMRMDTLKETARLNADKVSPAKPEDIQKFRDTFGKLGADVPDSISKGELSKAWTDASEQAMKGGFTLQAAKLGATTKKEVAEMLAEGKKEAAAKKLTEDEKKRNVPGVGIAITKNDADKLKESAIGHSGITKALSDISKDYGIITDSNTKTTEKIAAAQRMKVTQSKILMDYKKFFELGAPQKAELDFLGELVGKPDSTDLVKTIISDKTFGTNLNTRLSTLKTLLDSDFDNVKKLRLETPEEQTPAAAPTAPASGAPKAPTSTKPAKPVVIKKGQPLPD